MRISVEVGHPSHVHYWRNVLKLLSTKGHEVSILARRKEITLRLLEAYGLPYHLVGSSRPTLMWKALGLPIDDLTVLRTAKRLRIELMLSTGIPGSAHASRVLGIPHIALIDTEIASMGRLLTEPFSDAVCTPQCFRGRVDPRKHIRFNGYLELMYLRPEYFRPNRGVLQEAGLRHDDAFALVRFSSWDSSHDLGQDMRVLTTDEARFELVSALAKRYRVFVTSETALGGHWEQFELRIPPHRFHDLLASASLYVGEGATIASEAGILGVPWIYLSHSRRGYLDDQERRYATGKTVESAEEVMPLVDIWRESVPRGEWNRRRKALLDGTVDVTRFMVNLIDRWPESGRESRGDGLLPQSRGAGRQQGSIR